MPTDSKRKTARQGLETVLAAIDGTGEFFNDFTASGVVATKRETLGHQTIQPGTQIRLRDGASRRAPKKMTGERRIFLTLIAEVVVKRVDSDSLVDELADVLHDIELAIDQSALASPPLGGTCSAITDIQIPEPVYDFADKLATAEVRVTVEADIVEGSTV